MIIKALKTKNKRYSASKAMKYLLSKPDGQAKVLKGVPELSVAIANSLSFSNSYYVGVLSFEELESNEARKMDIIEAFEDSIFPFFKDKKDRYDITWIEHSDKGRTELNFFVPMVDLQTEKRLNVFNVSHQQDKDLFNTFRDYINLKYGYSNPNDPTKGHLIKPSDGLMKASSQSAKTAKEIIATIEEALNNDISQGLVEDRQGVIDTLVLNGYEITRQSKTSISIKNPNGGQNIKLKGDIFNEQFNIDELIARRSQEAERSKTADYTELGSNPRASEQDGASLDGSTDEVRRSLERLVERRERSQKLAYDRDFASGRGFEHLREQAQRMGAEAKHDSAKRANNRAEHNGASQNASLNLDQARGQRNGISDSHEPSRAENKGRGSDSGKPRSHDEQAEQRSRKHNGEIEADTSRDLCRSSVLRIDSDVRRLKPKIRTHKRSRTHRADDDELFNQIARGNEENSGVSQRTAKHNQSNNGEFQGEGSGFRQAESQYYGNGRGLFRESKQIEQNPLIRGDSAPIERVRLLGIGGESRNLRRVTAPNFGRGENDNTSSLDLNNDPRTIQRNEREISDDSQNDTGTPKQATRELGELFKSLTSQFRSQQANNESVISSRGTNESYREGISTFENICTKLAGVRERIRTIGERLATSYRRMREHKSGLFEYSAELGYRVGEFEQKIRPLEQLRAERIHKKVIEVVESPNPTPSPPQPVKAPRLR